MMIGVFCWNKWAGGGGGGGAEERMGHCASLGF